MIWVLASNSPRRRELLSLLDWDFMVRATDVDESIQPGEAPAAYVVRLALTKAMACSSNRLDGLVIAADTAVVDGTAILGKPKDSAEAGSMLRRLRGHTHQVYTGLAVLDPVNGNQLTDLCITDVPMRAYSEKEIDAYIASGDPLDKAGAYAIQHSGFQPVERLVGCYASVMGMPLCHLTRLLRKFDAHLPVDVPGKCQATLGYSCPISAAVLRGDNVG